MKTIKQIAAVLFIGALTLTSACKKPEKGDKGDTGATGATGATGNANVTSETLTIGSGGWSLNTTPTNFRYAQWTPSILTSTVITGGAVMVYQIISGTNTTYAALPVTQNIAAGLQEHDYFVY